MNDNFYCSAHYDVDDPGSCPMAPISRNINKPRCAFCKCYHRKWPTTEQFKEEYGGEWNGPYYFGFSNGYWSLTDVDWEGNVAVGKVCVCTPYGAPPKDWRPE